MPDGEVSDDSDGEYCNRRFQYLTNSKQHFCNRWHREYLVDLREHHKGKQESCNIIVNNIIVKKSDVVIVQEDNIKRGSWKMAVIEDLIVGRDGVFHGAKVRLV